MLKGRQTQARPACWPRVQSVFRPGLFDGKAVLVTGGATGIGFAIAQEFARLGAHVTVLSRNEAHLREATAKLGSRSRFHVADVRDGAAVAAAAKSLGPQDVVVNAAAGNFPVPFDAMTDNAWRTVIDIVLHGTANVCRAFGPGLRERRGSLLNIVAGYAWTGAPGVAHSGAAKAGVLNLSRSLAVEWAPDVRVNAVSPGPIDGTEGMKRLGDDLGLRPAVEKSVPLGRMGQAREVADACVFLASPAASYITGAVVVVDGGQDAKGPFGDILLG